MPRPPSRTPSTVRRKQTNVRLDEDIEASLAAIRDRDGIPISEQMRRALRAWIDAKGLTPASRRRKA